MKDRKNNSMSSRIKQITYDLAVNFTKGEPHLTHKKKFVYHGLYVDDVLVSIMAYDIGRNSTKLHAFYTPKEFRGRGYFSYLLGLIIKKLESSTDTKTLISDCLEDSKDIIERFGFELLREKQYKRFKVYYFRKDIS